MHPPSRRAIPDEAQRVSQLLQACGRDLNERLGLLNWSIPYPVAQIAEQIERGEVWVVEEEGEVLATLTLDFVLPDVYRANWFSQPDAPAGYLHRLAVSPERQGTGLGAHALAEAERLTLEQGKSWLRFDAYRRNTGIQRFYQRQGYTRLRDFEMKIAPFEQPEPFVLYEKPLWNQRGA